MLCIFHKCPTAIHHVHAVYWVVYCQLLAQYDHEIREATKNHPQSALPARPALEPVELQPLVPAQGNSKRQAQQRSTLYPKKVDHFIYFPLFSSLQGVSSLYLLPHLLIITQHRCCNKVTSPLAALVFWGMQNHRIHASCRPGVFFIWSGPSGHTSYQPFLCRRCSVSVEEFWHGAPCMSLQLRRHIQL